MTVILQYTFECLNKKIIGDLVELKMKILPQIFWMLHLHNRTSLLDSHVARFHLLGHHSTLLLHLQLRMKQILHHHQPWINRLLSNSDSSLLPIQLPCQLPCLIQVCFHPTRQVFLHPCGYWILVHLITCHHMFHLLLHYLLVHLSLLCLLVLHPF